MTMIESMLVLSTAHLSEQTCNSWLHNAPFAAFGKGDYGWFVHVPDDEPEDLPADLGTCLTQARSLACTWVMFDRDADIVPSPPVHDW